VQVKKLVYLYLINYAKSNPDLTIMVRVHTWCAGGGRMVMCSIALSHLNPAQAVNSFVKDSEHPSPLIRALAIRTMGCIRVEKITEYLAPPLKRALGDEDPYVRKTVRRAPRLAGLPQVAMHFPQPRACQHLRRRRRLVCLRTLRVWA